MPLVNISVVKGRSKESLQAFCKAVTEAAQEHLNAPLSSVRVVVTEHDPDIFYVGGKSKTELSKENTPKS